MTVLNLSYGILIFICMQSLNCLVIEASTPPKSIHNHTPCSPRIADALRRYVDPVLTCLLLHYATSAEPQPVFARPMG
jgi:hypothetical protein